jgi:hypothetical protein
MRLRHACAMPGFENQQLRALRSEHAGIKPLIGDRQRSGPANAPELLLQILSGHQGLCRARRLSRQRCADLADRDSCRLGARPLTAPTANAPRSADKLTLIIPAPSACSGCMADWTAASALSWFREDMANGKINGTSFVVPVPGRAIFWYCAVRAVSANGLTRRSIIGSNEPAPRLLVVRERRL